MCRPSIAFGAVGAMTVVASTTTGIGVVATAT
jgi:hypothetical protein